MSPDPEITTIAHVIQLAIAPVFLLTCIGSLLAVMAHRLGRIIDALLGTNLRWLVGCALRARNVGTGQRHLLFLARGARGEPHAAHRAATPPASQIGDATAGNNLTRSWKIARGRSR